MLTRRTILPTFTNLFDRGTYNRKLINKPTYKHLLSIYKHDTNKNNKLVKDHELLTNLDYKVSELQKQVNKLEQSKKIMFVQISCITGVGGSYFIIKLLNLFN
jgi:hypothetical protein